MKKLDFATLKTLRAFGFLFLALLLPQGISAQNIMFDDFTYSGTAELVNPASASNKWTIVDGRSGPPEGAMYSKNNIEFVADPANAKNKFMKVSTTVNGQTRGIVNSRVESSYEYFEGTYASRVYLTDEAFGTKDGNIQTYFTIVPSSLAQDGSKYSELDIVEYMAADKWGVSPNNQILYTTSYHKYIANPWKPWKTYTAQRKSYGGWHTFMAVCTDKVNVRYYIDGNLIATHSVTDNETQAGLPVYPRSTMQIAYANWIAANDLGPSTANRTNTMQVDWTLHYKNTALSYAEVNALVNSYRASGLQRRNMAGQTYSTGVSNQAPQIQLTAPANGTGYTAPASINITANASDADGTVSKVEFFNGASSLGSDLTAPYAFSWTNVAAGTYTLTAKATDNAGAVTTSSAVTVVVKPVVSTGPVSVYQNCNNDPGYVIALPVGTYTTAQLFALGINNNDISRVTVQSGYQVTLYNDDNLSGTSHTATGNVDCLTFVNFNDLTSSIKVSLVVVNNQTPYDGIFGTIPGTIEAEKYDLGGQGIAFNDVTAANEGGAFRTDAVDVEPLGTGYNVGYIATDEWLEYSVNVTAGSYRIDAHVAAIAADKTFRLELDGATIGNFTVPNTGAWGTFQVATVNNVTLTAGQKVLRLYATSAEFNVDKIIFSTAINPNVAPTVSLTAPANNTTLSAPASIAITANTSDSDGSVSKVEFYNGTQKLGEDLTAPYSYTWTNVAAGTYTISAKATDNSGASATSSAVSITVNTPIVETPYGGTAWSLPGTVQAENYNNGGEGIAYHDIEAANQGGAYRTTEGVDVEATTDSGAGYNVGYTADGEWLNYSVNVTTSGSYNVSFRTAGTGTASAIRMEIDGADVTGSVSLPNTTAWQTWATTTVPNIAFSAGAHKIRLFVVTGGFNLNSFTVALPTQNNMTFLRASGKSIVNNDGNYLIKAVNLGNYMVQEGYMMNLGGGYQWNVKNKIADVVGVASRDQFYKDYLNNFITKADIDSLAKFGFNSVRVPMHYNLFTPLGQPDTYIESGFAYIDNIIGWCKANNMYVILDLHAAPGGQSSGDISDYIAGQPSLWESAANRAQTVKLWRKFAERYANEPTVGAYDLINETNWTLANNNQLLMQIMKDITAAIRQVDNNHLLFIEGNSYANDYNGLTPKWDNNMAYSFHKYWNDPSQGSINFVLNIRDSQNVPIWLGEFGENSNHWIAESVTIMNNNNIGWAIWPYKKMSSVSSIGSFKQPDNWSALANYINGGAKPSAALGQAILNELLQNVTTQNLTFNKGYIYALIKQPNNNNTTPFMTLTLPGKVLAAHYDEGKNGYAFNDANYQNTQYGNPLGSSTSWNNGWYYRNDGVDLQYSTPENGPTIGYTENNEWLQYTVNVTTTGSYSVKLRTAGNGGKISISVDGTTLLNNVNVTATGGWDVWQTITLGNINLTTGKHTVRATINTAGYNLSYLDFSTAATPNQAPTVNLTSPVNGTNVNAPANLSLAATAADADGAVSKVEFYNGTTLIGTDATSPYSYTWTNVAAGTYSITAKAMDNVGATATSAVITVTVNTVVISNPCSSIATYVENGNYVPGSKVKNANTQYECKPYPYSGWCNGAAWAYAPGTGAYWSDAWTLVGSCAGSARSTSDVNVNEATLNNFPNPFANTTTVQLQIAEAGDVSVKVYDKTGQEVGTVVTGHLATGSYTFTFDANHLKADLYLIKLITNDKVFTRKMVKVE